LPGNLHKMPHYFLRNVLVGVCILPSLIYFTTYWAHIKFDILLLAKKYTIVFANMDFFIVESHGTYVLYCRIERV
jgi:hypothetical protein